MQDLTNTIRLAATDRGIRAAAALLRQGGTVAFPTETVYGLGADARDDRAVARIFEAKGRPHFNPLIVHVPDLGAARRLAAFTPQAERLASAFWPGALTLVLPRNPGSGLADLVSAGLPSVALRVPSHPLAVRLLREADMPIAAPSANPSGRVSPTTADHVMDGLTGRISAVLDGGDCPVGVESTIIGLAEGAPVLLRPGGLPAEAVEEALGQPLRLPASGKITAPGQLASHYAPGVSLLPAGAAEPRADDLWLAFGPLGSRRGLSLSPAKDMTEAAANLFSMLHRIDAMAQEAGAARVFYDPVPETGLGRAINDRLGRAAAPRPAT